MIDVNYLAVLACAVVGMVVGFLWYGPLFGKAWSKMMGWGEMTPEKMKEMQKKAMPGYVVQFIGALVMAYVLSHTYAYASEFTQTFGIAGGLMVGFWTWLGFIAPVTLGSILWEGKPISLWYINASFYLVELLAFGVIIALWV